MSGLLDKALRAGQRGLFPMAMIDEAAARTMVARILTDVERCCSSGSAVSRVTLPHGAKLPGQPIASSQASVNPSTWSAFKRRHGVSQVSIDPSRLSGQPAKDAFGRPKK